MPRTPEGIDHKLLAALLHDVDVYMNKTHPRLTKSGAMSAALKNQGINDRATRTPYMRAMRQHFIIEKAKLKQGATAVENERIMEAEELGISDGVRDGADIMEEQNS